MEGAVPSSSPERKHRVLVVDDEQAICRILSGVLGDEGFAVHSVHDGEAALQAVASFAPAVVLLDIWLPGADGIAVLKRMRELYPNLPVIMISGHASIATAISATKLGAIDFIEKPLDLHLTLGAVRRAVGQLEAERIARSWDPLEGTTNSDAGSFPSPAINPVVWADLFSPGTLVPQRTVAKGSVVYGQGLHTGRKSGLILEPLPVNSGIHFVGVSEEQAVPAHIDFVGSTGYATTVKLGRTQAGTIEHLMSALWAFGITNILIKCNSEVPVLDGSSREFCELLRTIGVVEQGASLPSLKVTEPIRIGDDREWIEIVPASGFSVEYTLNYPAPVGQQTFRFERSTVEHYESEIASARTFGFVKDIGWLQKQGLALGGRFDNFVLFGEEGPLNDKLRFPNEPVRHKILDALGDLYLLGRPLEGAVRASMTGHSDNVALLRAVRDTLGGKR